jgi:Rab-GTPase-TBC domain
VWKCVLGYFPRREAWETFLRERRLLYKIYVGTALASEQRWAVEIERDVRRTHILPDGRGKCRFLDSGTHREALFRILLVYSMTNSSIGYTQGMNRIAAVLYYTFEREEGAEEDTFFAFFNLMAEIGDSFSQAMDDSPSGLYRRMGRVFEILEVSDPRLYRSLCKSGVVFRGLFHLRWVLLMVSDQFSIDGVQALWDRFLSDKDRFRLVPFFCAEMISSARELLLGKSLEEVLSILQNHPFSEPARILERALRMAQP